MGADITVYERRTCSIWRALFTLLTERGVDIERDLELYGISCHPYGFLERRAPPPEPC